MVNIQKRYEMEKISIIEFVQKNSVDVRMNLDDSKRQMIFKIARYIDSLKDYPYNAEEKEIGDKMFENFKTFLYENGWDDIISLEKKKRMPKMFWQILTSILFPAFIAFAALIVYCLFTGKFK